MQNNSKNLNRSQLSNSLDNQINSYNLNTRSYRYEEPNEDELVTSIDNKNKNSNKISSNMNSSNSYQIKNSDIVEKQILRKKEEENEFHFQRKIRNSGFWGGVKLRKGTWLVILGAILMSISIIVIAVFWRWWYGPEINMPCRVIGITLLVVGLLSFILGLISNWFMSIDPSSKHFIGSPPRCSSWILLASIISLIIASVLMAVYYTYWHNRWVNTPLISISIILFFFGSIAFFVSIVKNFKTMQLIRNGRNTNDSNESENENLNEDSSQNSDQEEANERTDLAHLETEVPEQEPIEKKKDFRKKMVKLTPRNQNHIYLLSNSNQN